MSGPYLYICPDCNTAYDFGISTNPYLAGAELVVVVTPPGISAGPTTKAAYHVTTDQDLRQGITHIRNQICKCPTSAYSLQLTACFIQLESDALAILPTVAPNVLSTTPPVPTPGSLRYVLKPALPIAVDYASTTEPSCRHDWEEYTGLFKRDRTCRKCKIREDL